MEVSFEKISYKDKLSNISFKLDNNYVNGIYNANNLLKIIKEPSLISSGHIFIDDRIDRKYNSKFIAIIDNDKSFYIYQSALQSGCSQTKCFQLSWFSESH